MRKIFLIIAALLFASSAQAETITTTPVTLNNITGGPLAVAKGGFVPLNNAFLDVPFTDYALGNGQTFARTGTAQGFVPTGGVGILTDIAENIPTYKVDPTTAAVSGVVLQARATTNLIRNSILSGASVPSTFPTNWTVLASQGGITTTVAGTGTVNGMAYVDVNRSGTASNATSSIRVFEPSGATSATQGEKHTLLFYTKLISGSLTNVENIDLAYREYNGSTALGAGWTYVPITLTTSLQKVAITITVSDASTTQIRWGYRVLSTNGAASDFTFRIQQPQQTVTNGSVAPIKTLGSSTVTRNAESLIYSDPWWNINKEGVFLIEGTLQDTTTATEQTLFSIDDTSSDNRISVFVEANTGLVKARIVRLGGAAVEAATTKTLTTGSAFKIALKLNSGANALSVNGESATGSGFIASALPATTRVRFAANYNASTVANLVLSRFAFSKNTDMTAAMMNALTQ